MSNLEKSLILIVSVVGMVAGGVAGGAIAQILLGWPAIGILLGGSLAASLFVVIVNRLPYKF